MHSWLINIYIKIRAQEVEAVIVNFTPMAILPYSVFMKIGEMGAFFINFPYMCNDYM